MIDSSKIKKIQKYILGQLNKNNCSDEETISLIAELLFSVGASIMGRSNNPPDIDELNKLYYSKPSMDVACMITAIHINSWLSDEQTKTT